MIFSFRPIINICFFGDTGVGVRSIIRRFVDNHFVEQNGLDLEPYGNNRQINIDEKYYLLDLFYYGHLNIEEAIKMSHGFVLMFSINNRTSLDRLPEFKEMIIMIKQTTEPLLVVLGNKCDLEEERKITKEEGEEWGDKMGGAYFETSAKNDFNINEAMMYLAQSIIPYLPVEVKRKKCVIN